MPVSPLAVRVATLSRLRRLRAAYRLRFCFVRVVTRVGNSLLRFTRRGDQRESMLFRQSRRFRRFRSNSYDCGDPKEATVPTRTAQRARASWSAGEWREASCDSQEEPQPRVRTKQSSLPPKTSEWAESTSEQDWREGEAKKTVRREMKRHKHPTQPHHSTYSVPLPTPLTHL